MSLEREDVLFLNASEVEAALSGQELELVRLVRRAYEQHVAGMSVVPHSTLLRFPGRGSDRIMALPAWLGGDSELAGIKWVSSVPSNPSRGLERASAVIVLNDIETGRARVLMEGSLVNARRTAASAVLAAQVLHDEKSPQRVALLGCGRIQMEILHFLRIVFPSLRRAAVLDIDRGAADRFARTVTELHDGLDLTIKDSLDELFASAPLISIATTAPAPYIGLDVLAAAPPGATLLHVSLRDLAPEVVLTAENVVDDIAHVCRAETSLHLAEQQVGHRGFVHGALGDMTAAGRWERSDPGRAVVFSPFGLGILDLVVADLVCRRAQERGLGTPLRGFFPSPINLA